MSIDITGTLGGDRMRRRSLDSLGRRAAGLAENDRPSFFGIPSLDRCLGTFNVESWIRWSLEDSSRKTRCSLAFSPAHHYLYPSHPLWQTFYKRSLKSGKFPNPSVSHTD